MQRLCHACISRSREHDLHIKSPVRQVGTCAHRGFSFLRKIKSIFIQKCFTNFVQFTIIRDIVAGNFSVRIHRRKKGGLWGLPIKSASPSRCKSVGRRGEGSIERTFKSQNFGGCPSVWFQMRDTVSKYAGNCKTEGL